MPCNHELQGRYPRSQILGGHSERWTVVGATALRTERPEPSTEPASSSKGSDGKEEGKDKKKASTNSFRPLEEGQGELLRMTVSSK